MRDATFYLLSVRKVVILFDSSFLLTVDVFQYASVFVVNVNCLQHLKKVYVSYSVGRFFVINEKCMDILLVLDAILTDHSEKKMSGMKPNCKSGISGQILALIPSSTILIKILRA